MPRKMVGAVVAIAACLLLPGATLAGPRTKAVVAEIASVSSDCVKRISIQSEKGPILRATIDPECWNGFTTDMKKDYVGAIVKFIHEHDPSAEFGPVIFVDNGIRDVAVGRWSPMAGGPSVELK